jgi:dTMP kinase
LQTTGKFIVIEGLEGAGKSTAVAIITQAISATGHTVVNTREPGGTAMAEAIRDVVKHNWQDEKVTVEAELLLMYAARAQLVQKGHWVLGDRHDMSSQAYQGGGRQINHDMIENLRAITLKNFRPDFTLYMDVEPKEGLKRAKGRGELDRIEQEDLSFFERTRERYLFLAEQDKKCVVINTMQSLQSVHKDVELAINKFLER